MITPADHDLTVSAVELVSISRLMTSGDLSEVTKKGYRMRVNQYLRETGEDADTIVEQAKSDPRKFEEAFALFLQKRSAKSSTSTTIAFRDAMKKFLTINGAEEVNWQRVDRYVPRGKRTGADRAPTADELRRIIDVADLRTKCLVAFLCSSGARIGSVQSLKWRDIAKVTVEGQKFARVTIHGGGAQYTTFITPECYRFLQEYRQWRRGIGEKVTASSYVFATQGNARRFDPNKVKAASVKTMKNQLGALLRHLGVRSVISERGGYRNYEFKQAHGFRKFFRTRMEVAGVDPRTVERLMGGNRAETSAKLAKGELAAEYAKAIGELTMVKAEGILDKNAVLSVVRKEMLVGRYSEKEIAALGDLSKLTTNQFVRLLARKTKDSA